MSSHYDPTAQGVFIRHRKSGGTHGCFAHYKWRKLSFGLESSRSVASMYLSPFLHRRSVIYWGQEAVEGVGQLQRFLLYSCVSVLIMYLLLMTERAGNCNQRLQHTHCLAGTAIILQWIESSHWVVTYWAWAEKNVKLDDGQVWTAAFAPYARAQEQFAPYCCALAPLYGLVWHCSE